MESAGTLIFQFSLWNYEEYISVVYKPLSQWYPVITAQIDKDTVVNRNYNTSALPELTFY